MKKSTSHRVMVMNILFCVCVCVYGCSNNWRNGIIYNMTIRNANRAVELCQCQCFLHSLSLYQTWASTSVIVADVTIIKKKFLISFSCCAPSFQLGTLFYDETVLKPNDTDICTVWDWRERQCGYLHIYSATTMFMNMFRFKFQLFSERLSATFFGNGWQFQAKIVWKRCVFYIFFSFFFFCFFFLSVENAIFCRFWLEKFIFGHNFSLIFKQIQSIWKSTFRTWKLNHKMENSWKKMENL